MYGDVSSFEDLPTEVIREIFDYLVPHHLLHAFENLNSRYLSIITQHSFCLPENNRMSRQIYQYYMTYILPKYASQFRSLYFSNGQNADAIEEFVHTINSNLYSVLAMSLRIIKIFDITQPTFKSLIDHFHPLHHVHTLLITLHDAKIYCRHNNQSNYLYGEFYLLSILKTMPQLQSLSMYQISNYVRLSSWSIFNTPNFPTAHHLHTLRMSGCSYQFLTSLLNSGHVPRLRYLRVTFHDSSPWPRSNNEPPFPLSHLSIPELCQVHFKLDGISIGSVLMALTDVYSYGQLEKITLDQSSSYIYENWHMVSAHDLHCWLLLSSSKSCFFQLIFNVKRNFPPMNNIPTTLEEDLVDFKTLLNASISGPPCMGETFHNVSVFYPTVIENQQVKLEQNRVRSKEFLNIFDFNSTDKSEEQFMNVEHFPNLECLSLGNSGSEINTNECIKTLLPVVLHIVDRAPRLGELSISWAEDRLSSIAMLLSEMGACNQLRSSFKRQFKDLTIEKFNDNVPFLDLVELLINLLSDGNLEKLIFIDCLLSEVSQTFASFQQAICLLIERLPKVIYLSIHIPSFLNITIDRMELRKWLSGEMEPKLSRYGHWRYRNKKLDLWF